MVPLEIFQELLEVLHGALPKMSLIASDFSYLPDVRILGDRAPLVSTKVHSDPCFAVIVCFSILHFQGHSSSVVKLIFVGIISSGTLTESTISFVYSAYFYSRPEDHVA